ncbi:MAG: DUF4982 domain-containing protein [Clostridiales bacterium]|nr:DUF4982 domain-containing protein [Clostridiales bacterium]
MKSVDLNANWSLKAIGEEYRCDLPCDVTSAAERDYACSLGELNGYVPAQSACFTKALPHVKSGRAYLLIDGALGYGDVYLNDEQIARIFGHAPMRIDVTGKLVGAHNVLRIELTSAPGMSDKYVGLGIGGGVKLVIEDALDIADGTLFVKTATVGDKTYADAEMTVRNDGDEAARCVLECTVLNARGKRGGKKQKKIFVRARSSKTFTVRVRIAKPYEWTPSDPYVYTMTAKLVSGEEEHTASTPFGIATRTLNNKRGLYVNGKNTLLFGAYLSHADAALGGASVFVAEKRRLEALKHIGYNAVHFVGCPSGAALDALDAVGMYAYVDIFDTLVEGKTPLDGHIFNFDRTIRSCDVTESVIALRNHPSVVMYGVADDVAECYGRSNGHEIIADIASGIKRLDGTRPVTVSAREFVPTARELEQAGIKRRFDSDAAAVNAGREKDLFDTLTAGAFGAVDVCGFNYLDPLYETDKLKHSRLIVGSRTAADRAFEAVDEVEKNSLVIGDFGDCGMDYPGGGKLNEILNTNGDIDATYCEKVQGAYKRIILGARHQGFIAVLDPDTEEPVSMWNWPRYLGQTVTVCVYTSGDVTALYLNGRLIGRKLAGKINKHIAVFRTEYYPGTLEAVCYYKGVECARARLKTAGSPKTVKLSAYEKNLSLSRGDVGFVNIDVCDREGDTVAYAMRNLTVQIEGAELIAFINADPMLRKFENDTCPAYGGRAMCVIKPHTEGKATVKVTGDGLLTSRISFKVKE